MVGLADVGEGVGGSVGLGVTTRAVGGLETGGCVGLGVVGPI